MFDSDPASWAALVAQLVEHLSGVECRGFESHLRQLSFSFFHCLRCLSFFLSFFLSFYISCNIMYDVHVHVDLKY